MQTLQVTTLLTIQEHNALTVVAAKRGVSMQKILRLALRLYLKAEGYKLHPWKDVN